MTEILANPTLLTTDEDFRIYRRNGRQIIPVPRRPIICELEFVSRPEITHALHQLER